MDTEEFREQLASTPLSFRHKLRSYLRHPTERNACYIIGYIVALEDARLFKTDDAASYWLALIDRTEGNFTMSSSLIAEMDNPPAGGTQAAEIEALQESLAALKAGIEALQAENKRLRPADDEVVFIDGVGAGRSSVKSCRDGVQWIVVGDRVYWPLSDSDAKRLQSACCGNGSFDGPTMSAV